MLDFSVVGSGIGGSASALFLNKLGSCRVFEKDSNLGGCSSTFMHKKAYFNTGATTFAGFEDGLVTYEFFKKHNISINSKPLDKALVVLQGSKRVDRYYEFEKFLESLESAYPHSKHRSFYSLIQDINNRFYQESGYYYQNSSLTKKLFSLLSFRNLLLSFYPYMFQSAKEFITKFYGDVDRDYLEYLENQILIVTQTSLDKTNFLNAALALGYQFQKNHYIYGGLGTIFEQMEKRLDISKKDEVERIDIEQNHYLLHTKKQTVASKNIILNTTIFDAPKLFEDREVKEYFSKYKKLDEGVSAFMLYVRLKEIGKYEHHYQIIDEQKLPFSTSSSIFVSFGDKEDEKMNRSVTNSVHVKKSTWDSEWQSKTEFLEEKILKLLKKHLGIKKDMIEFCFSARAHTFERFINRSNLGGIPLLKKNLIYKLPGNDTPFKGLYQVGDSSFAAQGWAGVMMGVVNLQRLICKS
ncbi:MAG: phytoene desaturase family protein [Campylobacterales bacterium]